ncbi:hypothetical protein C8R43DRAFT_1125213 [Mycena crocata]|nr:hypothetical protein C8R43DRAFT_1125213 [Mycena crocata]
MEPQNSEDRPLFTTEALENSDGQIATAQRPADGIHYTEEVASVVRLGPPWGLQVSGNIDYSNVMAQLTATRSQLTAAKTQLNTTKSQLSTTKRYLSSARTQLRTTESELSTTQSELSALQLQLDSCKQEKSRLQLSLDQALVIVKDTLRSLGWVDIGQRMQSSDSRVPAAMLLSRSELRDFLHGSEGSDAPVSHHPRFGDANSACGHLAHRLHNPMALENLNNPIDNQTALSTAHSVSPPAPSTSKRSAVDCADLPPVAHNTSSGSERMDPAAASEAAALGVGNRYDCIAERRASTSSPTCGCRGSTIL